MFKKIFAIATVLCVIPVMANADLKWQLGTRAMTNGGTIESLNGTTQSVTAGAVFKAYTTTDTNVTLHAATGYKILKYSVNGSVTGGTIADGTVIHVDNPSVPGTAGKVSIQAWFARNGYTITATTSGAGTVNKSQYTNVYTGLLNPPKSFIFTPSDINVYVSGITVDGIAQTQSGTKGTIVFNILDATTGLPVTLGSNLNTSPLPAGSAPRPVKVQVDILNVGNANFTVAGTFSGTPAAKTSTSQSCIDCHNTQSVGPTVEAAFNASSHKNVLVCATCHVGADTAAHPGAVTRSACTPCHGASATLATSGAAAATAAHAAVPNPAAIAGSCIVCHAGAINSGPGYVQDNNGVRAITTEFTKWSHHVTGVALQDAHCAACHMEGKAQGGVIVVDTLYHMADAKTHLRDTTTNADVDFAWDPESPDHSGMDTFCMSCHDGNGAVSAQSTAIRAIMIPAPTKTASATNPFGDTISNRYDKMQRPGVVNVSAQFATTNNSHHAVNGPRYTKRTRVIDAGDPRAMTAAESTAFAANSTATLKGKRSTIYDTKIGVATPVSILNQLYVPLADAAGEAAPRTGSQSLGDDSTLHCGDCHTVGQWKPGVATNAAGVVNTVAIGAHGSNNEYMLRNSTGSDERHTQNAYTSATGVITWTNPNGAFLVCYNCHTYAQYGSVFNATGMGQTNGATAPHIGEYTSAGRCNGPGNTIPFNGYTTGTATDGTQFPSRFDGPLTKYSSAASYSGEQNPDFGNIFGIQCLNCHNSGLGNAYGGIHGSANDTTTTGTTPAAIAAANSVPALTGGAYVDGMGNATKVQRFLPGLGDAMHVPGTLGGFTGGSTASFHKYSSNGIDTGRTQYTYKTNAISSDTNWEQKHWQQTASTNFGAASASGTLTSAGAGCYTLGETDVDKVPAAEALVGPSVTGETGPATGNFGVWGGCDDHAAVQGGADHGFIKRVVRPVTY